MHNKMRDYPTDYQIINKIFKAYKKSKYGTMNKINASPHTTYHIDWHTSRKIVDKFGRLQKIFDSRRAMHSVMLSCL